MNSLIAAFPMYDWPEVRDEVDAQWAALRDRLRQAGIEAPDKLARRNADMPPVPGGIKDEDGMVIAPDPATLPPDELDLPTLWRHPELLIAQTCWGPLEGGLADRVDVIWQPDYSAFPGGSGRNYRSAILIRDPDLAAAQTEEGAVPVPADGSAVLPIDLFRGARLAFNSTDSMSGQLALMRDLAALGEGVSLFAELIQTGSHRASIKAVAAGDADICAIDGRSWGLALLHEPAAKDLAVIGWTAERPGLPFVTAKGRRHLPASIFDT